MKIFNVALHIALKDIRHSFRGAAGLGMMLAAPLLITGLIYFAFGGLATGQGSFDLPTLRVAVVNLDQPANGLDLGRDLVAMLHDERIPRWIELSEIADESAARAALANRALDVAIVVPSDLSSVATTSDRVARIAILHDPTLTIGPAIVKDIVGLFLDGIQGTRIALEVAPGGSPQAIAAPYAEWYANFQRDLYHGANPPIIVQRPTSEADATTSRSTIALMMGTVMAGMLVFFVFNTAANSAQSILREDEDGTLARLFFTPVPRVAVLGGKFLAVFATVLVQSVVLLAVSALAFGIAWGQTASLALATLGLSAAATGFGVLLMSFVKNSRQAGPVSGGVITTMGMLGGLFTTGISMPPAFEAVNRALPQGWALGGYKLALAGSDPAALALSTGVLLLMGLAFFAGGAALFRRRYA